MKTYSFKLNNTKKNNKKNNINKNFDSSFSSLLSSIISSNVIKNNPWMEDICEDHIFIPKKDDHITFIKTKNTPTYNFDEFLTAMNYLAGLDTLKDTYDYELTDGTPVKIFNDEIQIGFDLIPIKYGYTPTMFAGLKPKTKKTIIDIYIKLNN